ncbi:MAG: hypothetical protein HMLKMBBP_03666 [Planctomycetes bacterium]|nr:hypothetical protein [Planctomycetota bacterium]
MTVRRACPHCRGEMLLEAAHEGRAWPCPWCGREVGVLAGTAGAGAEGAVPEPARHVEDRGLESATIVVVAVAVLFVPCSAGFSLILSPVALVMAVLAWRRRRRAAQSPPTAFAIAAVGAALGTLACLALAGVAALAVLLGS